MSQFREILVFGDSRFLGNAYAKKFVGPLEGNADSATKAVKDNLNQVIDSTYIKGASVSGQTVTFTKGDGSTFSFDTQDTHVVVVDSDASTATDQALSANQGKLLRDDISALEAAAGISILT
jgi:hypothetical protein